ncbi:UNVERIFIED_CONTAM: Transposon Ty3-G Gag-Pol polyprotein [Sesamum calycinum]|uniref:Transposon Ty3-G Gag-Pol polyprotein n=1 Tax=Sesamum calycinum TaxID=2727403 RepID=A0AAW2SUL7_9LAMI
MLLLLDDPLNLFDTCPDSEDVPSSPEAAFTDGVLFQLSPAAVSGFSSPSPQYHSTSGGDLPLLGGILTSVFPRTRWQRRHLHCSGVCRDVPLLLQYNFSVSLYVIPIFGADIVLGVQWLSSLGLFISDFSVPSMQFAHNGHWVTLTGSPSSTPRFASYSHVCRFAATDSIQSLCLLSITDLSSNSDSSPHSLSAPVHPDIRPLLDQYTSVFSVPRGLPPHRPQDHHIFLLPNQSPVNIKPYIYPHFQKDIMTQMITDMLHEGIITPSTSPFSSLVLLVRKKDGTWRFCVDYRALNVVTVPDRFPIPTVDELLDELHDAKIDAAQDRTGDLQCVKLT